MKLGTPADLDAVLGKRQLAPVFVVFGEEPLQLMEARDKVRRAARDAGFDEWQLFFVQPGFSWGSVYESAETLSLFGGRRLLDVRIPEKPDREASEWLVDYMSRPSPDCILLVSIGKLSVDDQKKSWFRTSEQCGVVLQVRSLEGPDLLKWLDRRMSAKGLLADQSGLRLLAARVEGNLLAAVQEVEKLATLFGQGRIDDAQIASAVADAARYDVFDLGDAVLGDRPGRIYRILDGLRHEGVAPAVVLWVLAREARLLAMAAFALTKGERLDSVMGRLRVWENRRRLLSDALRLGSLARFHDGLVLCARADRVIKGQEPGDAWDALLDVCVALRGTPA